MMFNFDEGNLNKFSKEPKVFYLPPTNNFAKYFFEGLLSKCDLRVLESNPELLSHMKIITSNKRLAQTIEGLFENNGFTILPKILDLTDLSEIFYEQSVGSFDLNQAFNE